MNYRTLFKIAGLSLLAMACAVPYARAQQVSPQSLNSPGKENEVIAARTGLWAVTETSWPAPGVQPTSITGLVAERKLMGSVLQEFIYASNDSTAKTVKRTDLLTYNRVEGQWDYVSYDARVPVGLMPAWSPAKGDGKTIELSFYPFALPGNSDQVSGQLVRMEQIITYLSADSDVKEQYFMPADGSGKKWLAHRYEFHRIKQSK